MLHGRTQPKSYPKCYLDVGSIDQKGCCVGHKHSNSAFGTQPLLKDRFPKYDKKYTPGSCLCSARVLATNNSTQLSKSFGGIHGTKFSDKASVVNGQTLRSISIYTGTRFVTGISLEINKPKPRKRKLVLGPKEHITSMEVYWDTVLRRTRIVYLGFNITRSLRVSKRKQRAPKGFYLGGVFGLADKGIVKLGVIWTRISAKASRAPLSVAILTSMSGSTDSSTLEPTSASDDTSLLERSLHQTPDRKLRIPQLQAVLQQNPLRLQGYLRQHHRRQINTKSIRFEWFRNRICFAFRDICIGIG
ncbi:LOW QUALITY PROTEIN: hypothetical protein PHMEG_00024049 [Phytophthora megakarya]|uniref:Jacalin-type lectin domain-containing protein n=1 Tax=Phytophthora megakarya TaxID=4795 RepID=A0A225VFG1_9STRA|nr:LOW QUALITY PROTEIN: hypothetical protein PHMEG_00024049 [Phytophthora megakarya]